MNLEKFLSIFKLEEISETLKLLAKKQLEEQMWVADGFELSATSTDALQYFIRDEEKLKREEHSFLLFAQATHSGSILAFYKKDGSTTCDDWPVVVLGDEGGAVVLAENIFQLMRFFTLNSVQPYIGSDYQSFDLFSNDEEESIPSNQLYTDWIKNQFGLQAIASIDQAKKEIIEPAIEKYQKIINGYFDYV